MTMSWTRMTRPFTKIALRAQREIEPMIAMGIARSKGQGVAMTNTARKMMDSPLITQAKMAKAKATGV